MGFFVTVFSILALSYAYVAWRLLAAGTAGRRGVIVAAAGFAMWMGLLVTTHALRRQGIGHAPAELIVTAGFVFAGFLSILLVLFIGRDALLLAWRITTLLPHRRSAGNAPNGSGEPLSRRRLFLQASNATLLATGAGLTGVGYHQARRLAKIEPVDVVIANLSPDLQGLRIVQLSDLHVGPTVKHDFVRRVVDAVRRLPADLIVITGDLVDGSVAALAHDVAPLKELSAPLGVYFVTGNHEYYSGVEPWLEHIDKLGATVLLNEHRVLKRGNASLLLAGVTDYKAGQRLATHASDPRMAVTAAPATDLRLLLAHQPWSAVEAERHGFDLMLCGHTHGGQFFPWNIFVDFFHPHVRGLNRRASGMQVYVSRGTGYWGPPLRTGVPSEITYLTLKSA